MKLRSGTPYWRVIRPETISASTLSANVRCDVLVLGGGITGALIAHRLIRQGVDTVLIDRGEPGCGSTAASTGLLQYETDTSLDELVRKVGERNAVHAYRRGLEAIQEIEQLVGELGDSCGYVRRESLYFASSWWHRRRLRREYLSRKKHGFDVELLDRREISRLFSIPSSLAILSRGDAQIDPYRLTEGLLTAAAGSGMRMYSHTRIERIDECAEKVVLTSPLGTITAGCIVYATGYEAYRHLSRNVGSLHSTYAVVSEPVEEFVGWHDHCLIWETARPYFYARQTMDGRAMIGGEDTLFSDDHERDGLVEAKTERLLKRFKTLFPALQFLPAYNWAGTFSETKDGLAYIGQEPGRKRAYFALGYGGNGITFSMIAARLIADLYLGKPNQDAEVFRFER